MKIKKYLVKRIEDAIYQIKRDLGEDAYILAQKKVLKKGKLNLSSVEMIEVTAAVETAATRPGDISRAMLNRSYRGGGTEGGHRRKEEVFDHLRPRKEDTHVDAAAVGGGNIKDELLPLTREVEEIKKLLRAGTTSFEGFSEFKGPFMELFMELLEGGVEKKLAGKLIHTLQYQTDAAGMGNVPLIRKRLFNLLTSFISVPAPLKPEKGKRKVVVMLGPTGAGKTTTIAKLASYYKLMESRKVALITIDSYRIGAESQLRTYAEILDVPFYSVYNDRELRLRLDRLGDCQLVFVDTTGRSPNDKKGLLIMEKHLSGVPREEREVYLVLSASTKTEDLYHIYDKYKMFKPDRFIFSKIDESSVLGNLFNLRMKTDIPTAYFTTGQRVPEDIEIAYPRKFARRVFLNYNGADDENDDINDDINGGINGDINGKRRGGR